MEENINFQSEAMDTTPSPDFNDTDTVSENSSTTLNTTEEPLVTVKYNHNLKSYSLKEWGGKECINLTMGITVVHQLILVIQVVLADMGMR